MEDADTNLVKGICTLIYKKSVCVSVRELNQLKALKLFPIQRIIRASIPSFYYLLIFSINDFTFHINVRDASSSSITSWSSHLKLKNISLNRSRKYLNRSCRDPTMFPMEAPTLDCPMMMCGKLTESCCWSAARRSEGLPAFNSPAPATTSSLFHLHSLNN